jgi:epoxyqueuosine reductase
MMKTSRPGNRNRAQISRSDWIKGRALELGFDAVGITLAEPGKHFPFFLEWLAAGYHGEQSYLARPDRLARRQDLEVILPGVQSLVIVGAHYGPRAPSPDLDSKDPDRGRISIYARGRDYHDVMLERLETLLTQFRQQAGRDVRGRTYVDTGPLLERDHALQAGLGFFGKNCNLIQPRRGSWLFLGVLMLDVHLDEDRPANRIPDPRETRCGTCERCLNACPTGALLRPYTLDSRRCISYLTTALKGTIPRELRPLMGNWVFGCDICQQVCPWNRFSRPGPLFDTMTPESSHLAKLMTLSEDDFQARFGHTPIDHIKRPRFLRNVAVALGNWGSPEATPVLARAIEDPQPLIREHAAWALGQIGDSSARNALKAALAREQEPAVVAEISWALHPDRQAPPG